MSKLLIPNTTQVPNILLDVVMPAIKNASLRVLLAVARKTYGFQKAADDISLTQLQKLTGLSRQGVVNGIAGLGNLLGVENGNDGINRYRLNVDVSSGELVNLFDQSKKLTSQKHDLKGSQRSRHTKLNKNKTNKTTEPNGSSIPSHFEKRKQSVPDPAALAAFDRFYHVYPRHVGREDALKAWLKLNPNAELIAMLMVAVPLYAAEVAGTEPKYILHPATWLNGRRWEDEPINSNGNGHGKPAQVKDLGNGMIEVNGVQMDRRIYERRYGYHAS